MQGLLEAQIITQLRVLTKRSGNSAVDTSGHLRKIILNLLHVECPCGALSWALGLLSKGRGSHIQYPTAMRDRLKG